MKKLNIILLIFNLVLLTGIIWIFNKNTDYIEIKNDYIETNQVIVKDKNELKEYEIKNKKEFDDLDIYLPTSTINIKEEKELIQEIPAQINLPVPFTSQAPEKNWDQPWQDACEEAVILMLDAYYKSYGLSPFFSRDEILKMVEWEEGQGWGTSIEANDVVKLIQWYGGKYKDLNTQIYKQIRIVESPNVDDIKKFVAGGDPVLVLAYGKDLPNPHFSGDGPEYHALIIRGYNEDEFITNDPGTQFGENFRYKYDDLMNAMHDWNGGDVENGRKIIIVLE